MRREYVPPRDQNLYEKIEAILSKDSYVNIRYGTIEPEERFVELLKTHPHMVTIRWVGGELNTSSDLKSAMELSDWCEAQGYDHEWSHGSALYFFFVKKEHAALFKLFHV